MIKIFLTFIGVCLVPYFLQNGVVEAGSGLFDSEEDTDFNSDSLGNYIIQNLRQDVITLQQKFKAMEQQFEDKIAKQAIKISHLEQRVAYLESDLGAIITCHNRSTDWTPDGRGNMVYLDKQHVRCNQKEYLSYFHLERNGQRTSVRYQYICCSML